MKVNHFAELSYRTIFGKRKIGLLFDMYAWFMFWQNSEDKEFNLQQFLYAAYISWSKDTGKRIRFDEDKFNQLLKFAPHFEVERINEVLTESSKHIRDINEKAQEELKKKLAVMT
jgi:phage/plasmid-associated DNA primase